MDEAKIITISVPESWTYQKSKKCPAVHIPFVTKCRSVTGELSGDIFSFVDDGKIIKCGINRFGGVTYVSHPPKWAGPERESGCQLSIEQRCYWNLEHNRRATPEEIKKQIEIINLLEERIKAAR